MVSTGLQLPNQSFDLSCYIFALTQWQRKVWLEQVSITDRTAMLIRIQYWIAGQIRQFVAEFCSSKTNLWFRIISMSLVLVHMIMMKYNKNWTKRAIPEETKMYEYVCMDMSFATIVLFSFFISCVQFDSPSNSFFSIFFSPIYQIQLLGYC